MGNTSELCYQLGAVLGMHGDYCRATGDTSSAVTYFEESVEFLSKLSGNDPEITHTLSISLNKIGDLKYYDGDLQAARSCYFKSLDVRRDTVKHNPNAPSQENLWNAWVTTSELRHKVTLKRVKLLLLRHKLKLTSILKGQIKYLEEWALLDRDHSTSLQGANEALQASTLRLPVVGKAIVCSCYFQKLKNSVGSAADVMQAMASSTSRSSICSLSICNLF